MAVQISGNDITVPRDGSFTRNVTIGGTLTYEDVTNIDSVGLVTARTGIEIGARPGVAASISVDGNMIVSGISTFGGDVQVPDKIIHSGDTNTAIRFPAADTITAETGGSERVRIDSSGRMGIGDDSPDRELVVKHASSNSTIKIESANTHTSQLMFADSDGEQVGRVAVFHGSGQVTSDSLTLDTAGTARIRVEPAGNVNLAQNLKVTGICTATSFSGIGAITMFDSWGLSSGTNYNDDSYITNDWTRRTGTHGGNIGNAMTESSGVFTFPQTGLYYISAQFGLYAVGGTMGYGGIRIYLSTDGGSSYTSVSTSYTSMQSAQYGRISHQELFDVTDASNFKIKFQTDSENQMSVQGGQGRTSVYFIRYGDT